MNDSKRMYLKFPTPYFGGKSSIASKIWAALGNPDHYIEPFFGSGAILLNRPHWTQQKTETVNDIDSNLCNVWRALQFKPDDVARWCDWPVNHDDLRARKQELIKNKEMLRKELISNPEFCDAKMAGYWIWAASCWIGSGLTSPGQRPHLADKGKGVHAAGQIPHLGDKGKGVQDPYNNNLWTWFRSLSERLRYVRVVCGQWHQVCGGNWQDSTWKTVGMYFDPPYGIESRANVYGEYDSTDIANEVMNWCKERGSRKNYRIVLSGYEEYMDLVENHGWHIKRWSAKGGYTNTSKKETSRGKENRHRETIYYSPHCNSDMPLFA